MYEASFGLKRRPFAATPDATCFLSAGPIQAALDEIVVCIEQGQGIAVVTAPAGIGKTLLCEKLVSELGTRFQTVFLRHSSFLTRRALLQTLLCDLKRTFHQPSEQELRLELLPAIREIRREKEALVVICDEAHQLTESLIEELRILADFAESGQPLVRLVLVGQLSLEEKLTQPSLEAFNQRIRAHVNLPTFDRAGSYDYIDYRLTWGGGRTDEIFTPAALEVIARASDGIPRCMNQLADHALLLGYVAEQRPVGEEIVLEALNDLRQLPLHWNETSLSQSFVETSDHMEDFGDLESHSHTSHYDAEEVIVESSTGGQTFSYEPTISSESVESLPETVTFEFGTEHIDETAATARSLEIHDLTFESSETADEVKIDAGSEDWRQTLSLFQPSHSDVKPVDTISAVADALPLVTVLPSALPLTLPKSSFHEEVVIDRYVSIDAGLPPVEEPIADLTVAEVPAATMMIADTMAGEEVRTASLVAGAFDEVVPGDQIEIAETERLKQVLGVVRELIEVVSESVVEPQAEPDREIAHLENVAGRIDSSHEISGPSGPIASDHEVLMKTLRRNSADADSDAAEKDFDSDSNLANSSVWESVETTPVEVHEKPRPFRYLFSMLRRKQQQSH